MVWFLSQCWFWIRETQADCLVGWHDIDMTMTLLFPILILSLGIWTTSIHQSNIKMYPFLRIFIPPAPRTKIFQTRKADEVWTSLNFTSLPGRVLLDLNGPTWGNYKCLCNIYLCKFWIQIFPCGWIFLNLNWKVWRATLKVWRVVNATY